MKIHLVDGTYELFRAYYGTPPRRSTDGMEVGATTGLTASLLAMLREEATHVAVAFDHVIESFRNDLFAGYKTGDGVEPELKAQFHLAEDAVRALGVVVWPMIEFEADDAMAAGAARFRGAPGVEQIVLCSPDKDLAQCVIGQEIVCLDRRRKIVLDEEGVGTKFGVAPASIPDWLALVGDTADGIPGIPRWGEKSSATVLARYRHLEAIPDDAASWEVTVRGAVALAQNLAARRQDAALYRHLATLRTDVPLAESLADLEWHGALREPLSELCRRWDTPDLLERVPRWRAA